MSGYLPYTGFGDDYNTSVKFGVLMNGDEAPDWTGGDRILNYFDVGNGQQVIQRGGWNPWIMECILSFDNKEAMELFMSLQGESATLRIPWGTTKTVGGIKRTIGNADYLVLEETLLVAATPFQNANIIEGDRNASATFRRFYVPSPYVGFTVVGEDE